MKTKWFTGLGLVMALLLGIGVIAAVLPGQAQAYYPSGEQDTWYGARQGQRAQNGGSTALTTLSAQSLEALNEAIQEEYLARDTYQAIISKFGDVVPFANILQSEEQHIAALARQYTNQGLAVPADSWAGKVQAPATVSEAFSAAIQLEKDDAALYDTLLKSVTEPTLTRVFTQLQSASLNMHLKSLEYYNN